MNCPDLLTKLSTLQTHAKHLRDEIFKIRIQERFRTLPSEVREELRGKWKVKKEEVDSVLTAINTAQTNLKIGYEEALTQLKLNQLIELLQLDSQYTSEIEMQMKRKGTVRGSSTENFKEKEIDVGWIEKRDDGTLFYKDYRWKLAKPEDDKFQFEHTLPDYKASFTNWVRDLGEGSILKGIEILKKKHSQGFTHLLYRCTGVELQRLYEQTEAMLIEATSPNGDGLYLPGKPLIKSERDRGNKITNISSDKACYFSDAYTNDNKYNEDGSGVLDVDIRGDLILFPVKYDEQDHGGLTFEKYLKTTGPFQWSLLVPEGNLLRSSDIATEELIGDRKRVRTKKSAEEYLKETRFEVSYAHESWMTLHEDLSFRHSLMSRFGIVLDNDTATWVPGSYIKGRGVPDLVWGETASRMYVDCHSPDRDYVNCGVRRAVKSK